MEPAALNDCTVRALITVPVDAKEHKACTNINAKIEAITAGFILAEIPKPDFEVLRQEHKVSELLKIPRKDRLPFPPPAKPCYYDLRIPGPLLVHWREQLKELGINLEQKLESECYVVYLSPEQVQKVYPLPFVHSVSIHNPRIDRGQIDQKAGEGAVAIFLEFHAEAKAQLQEFFEANKQTFRKLEDSGCWFTIENRMQIPFLEKLAEQPYVRAIYWLAAPDGRLVEDQNK